MAGTLEKDRTACTKVKRCERIKNVTVGEQKREYLNTRQDKCHQAGSLESHTGNLESYGEGPDPKARERKFPQTESREQTIKPVDLGCPIQQPLATECLLEMQLVQPGN